MIMTNLTKNNIFTYYISKNKILVYMPYSNYAVILNETEINMLGTALENNQERVPRQIEEILSFANHHIPPCGQGGSDHRSAFPAA